MESKLGKQLGKDLDPELNGITAIKLSRWLLVHKDGHILPCNYGTEEEADRAAKALEIASPNNDSKGYTPVEFTAEIGQEEQLRVEG